MKDRLTNKLVTERQTYKETGDWKTILQTYNLVTERQTYKQTGDWKTSDCSVFSQYF